MAFQCDSDMLFDAADLGMTAMSFEMVAPNQIFYPNPSCLDRKYTKLADPQPCAVSCSTCDTPADEIYNALANNVYGGIVHFCPYEIVFVMEEK